MMEQAWFELREFRRRPLEGSVWIPLRSVQVLERTGKFGFLGHREEFYGAGSLAVFESERAEAETLGWMEVGISTNHAGGIQDGRYIPSDVYETNDRGAIGINLLLDQRGNRDEPEQWHLHQDFVLSLGLKRELDSWFALDEGYLEVARLTRDADGRPSLLVVRAEHLKDYLCARGMHLYCTSYRSRREVVADTRT